MTSFGELFTTFRLRAGFSSLSQLADAFAERGYFYEISTFCRWQKGKRIPTKRALLLQLLALFIERKAIRSIEEANVFLESAEQGYLTKKEQEHFLKINPHISQN